METIINILSEIVKILLITIVFVSIIGFIFRLCLEKCKRHEIYKLLDSHGAIQILDSEGLIAILYRDRTIDWMRSTSFFKMCKIKEISDRFEDEYQLLEDEAHCKIVKNWRKDDAID